MRILFTYIIILLLFACNSTKQVQKRINSGDYDSAINISVKKLRKNKFKKRNQNHIILLQKAFNKAVARDKEYIAFNKGDNSIKSLELIFEKYNALESRQEKIKPLLPLKILGTNKKLFFNIEDYKINLISSKTDLVNALYNKSLKSLNNNTNSKKDFRMIYEDLKYLNSLSPDFKNVKNLIKEVHFKGTDFVYVFIKNDSNQLIPKRLNDELLKFDTYGLNNLWTVYHNRIDRNITYDYRVELAFKDIQFSPERVKERTFIKDKVIKETSIVKDSTGVSTKLIKEKKVSCEFYEIRQLKTCDITAKVNVYNNNTGQRTGNYPLVSGFVFDHAYSTYKGDKRAIDDSYLDVVNAKEVSFPSNEQMVYDAGSDLKAKLKDIIIQFELD